MTWTQIYAPLGNLYLSAGVAALPVLLLLGLLAWGRLRAYQAALVGLAAALVLVLAVYGMPISLALMASANGAAYGLFPIGWIVLSAMFLYDVSVRTGTLETVKGSIAGLAGDRRIQAILIAFSFGAFLEGAAGFGTPVAIGAAMLIGLGFPAVPAAGLALIGNTVPVPYAAMGTPLIALASVTGLPLQSLSAMVGRQMTVLSLAVPFCMVWALCGWRSMLEVWPVCLAAGLSFGLVQLLVSNALGPWMVDLIAAAASVLAVMALLQRWQPRRTWDFPVSAAGHESPAGGRDGPASPGGQAVQRVPHRRGGTVAPQLRSGAGHLLRAWLPWIMLLVASFVWAVPEVRAAMDRVSTVIITVPLLHQAVIRVPPVVASPIAEPAILKLNLLSASGTCIFLTGITSGLLLGLRPRQLVGIFTGTARRVKNSMLTIAAMMSLGYLTRFAGLDATTGLAFAAAGPLFPFFSPVLGGLGAALTGSVTSSNVLFGNLQQITAARLGFPAILAAGSNCSGGVLGKMLDAQSLVVASVATGETGKEGVILRYVFPSGLILAVLIGMIVMALAYLVPGMVPQ